MGEDREHILSRFDDDLNGLRELALRMGELVVSLVEKVAQALLSTDPGLARQILHQTKRVNEFDMEGQEEGVRILATHSPVARDLRLVVCLTRTVLDLEHCADQAKKVAEITLRHAEDHHTPVPGSELFEDVDDLTEQAAGMLRQALQAIDANDIRLAVAVVQADDRLNQMFEGAMRRLATFLLEDHRTIRWVMDAILALKAMERVGDHARNIAEHLIFAVKAKDVRYIKAEHLSEGYLDD